MKVIKTRNNIDCELQMAKIRLGLLMDGKEQLYAKYFPVTQKIKDDVINGGKKDNDKMAQYVHELNEVDIGTGFSLAGEIEYQKERINKLTHAINKIDKVAKNIKGIDFVLFCRIIIDGVDISKAVRDIAMLYKLSESAVWKYHYSKIKKDIKTFYI